MQNEQLTSAIQATRRPIIKAKPSGGGVKRYAYTFDTGNDDFKRRPDNSISPDILRRFSVTHEVSRICINARKRQMAQLDWDITPLKSSGMRIGDVTNQTAIVKKYFKHLGGYKSRFRALQDMVVEDLLVLDQISLYKERNAAQQLLWLKPVDAATIKIVVDQWGNTPEPPNIAYRQYIRGQLQAEFTADDLVFDMMNPRTTTPYGLAPLESLIIVVSSALRSSLFNLDYLSYQDIPEGLLEMPEGWSQGMIDEFKDAWEALVSGNTEASSKLRVVPAGTKYSPTKKPDDMAFNQFNWWLMQITCAMFDIQPHEIGFTDTANKATAKEQDDVTLRRGIKPLAQMMKEIWDDIIQVDLGFENLEFTYKGLEDEDDLLDAQAMKIRIQTGELSIDEARELDGLEPVGLDVPYILAGTAVTWVTSGTVQLDLANQLNDGDNSNEEPADPGDDEPENDGSGGDSDANSHVDPDYNPSTDQPNSNNSVQTGDNPTDLMKELVIDWEKNIDDELAKFQTFAINRIKKGKGSRDFESKVLHPALVAELNVHISQAKKPVDIIKAIRVISEVAKTSDANKVKQNKTLKALYGAAGYKAVKSSLKAGLTAQMAAVAKDLKRTDKAPPDTQAFLDRATPAIAKTVADDTTTQISDLGKQVYEAVVPASYKTVADADVDFNLTSPTITRTLAENASDILSKSTLDATTKKLLTPIINNGFAAGNTPAQIADAITDATDNITDYRADMIARTETQNFYAAAQQDAFESMGVETKKWVTYGENPCQICVDNEAAGSINIKDDFPSGDDWTPGHINCECDVDTDDDMTGVDADSLWDGS